MNLLTGGLGFIGSACLAEIALNHDPTEWILLIRAHDLDEARNRLISALGIYFKNPIEVAERFHIIFGDLNSLVHANLDVERIVHLAADTSFTNSNAVWSANFDGTMALANAARKMKNLKHFLHVSSAFRNGSAPRDKIIKECEPNAYLEHHVEYTASKAATEIALSIGYNKLPITVVQPSAVVGHTSIGCTPSSSIFWYFRLLSHLNSIPCKSTSKIDIVPVDWVAKNLLRLVYSDRLSHKIYHLSCGKKSLSIGDIMHMFGNTENVPVFDIDKDRSTISDKINSLVNDAVTARAMMAAMWKYSKFVEQNILFDNERLLEIGVEAPPQFHQWFNKCLNLPRCSILSAFNDDKIAFI